MGAERKIWDANAMDVAEVEAMEEAADDGFSMLPSSPLTLDISLPLPLLKPHITYYCSPLSLSLVYGDLGFLFSISGFVGRFQFFEYRFTENCAGICSRNGGSMTILVSLSRRYLVASRIFVSIFFVFSDIADRFSVCWCLDWVELGVEFIIF